MVDGRSAQVAIDVMNGTKLMVPILDLISMLQSGRGAGELRTRATVFRAGA